MRSIHRPCFYNCGMGMGTRKDQEKQEDIWIATSELARTPGHRLYERLNEPLDGKKFDAFVEGLCRNFYAPRMGRPGLAPEIYFRSLLIISCSALAMRIQCLVLHPSCRVSFCNPVTVANASF